LSCATSDFEGRLVDAEQNISRFQGPVRLNRNLDNLAGDVWHDLDGMAGNENRP
jgi:hypothetical protein